MSHFVACVNEQVRKRNLKELVKAHTGLRLTPPVFIAVVAFAAAGTALTVLAVSSLLVPQKKNDKLHEAPIDDDIMTHTPSNQREVDAIPVSLESPIIDHDQEEKEEKEEEAIYVKTTEEGEPPANDVEVPVQNEVEAPLKVETTTSKATDGEDDIRSVKILGNAPKGDDAQKSGFTGYFNKYIAAVAIVVSAGAIAAVGVVPAVLLTTAATVSVLMSPTQKDDKNTEVVTAEEETQKDDPDTNVVTAEEETQKE